MTEYDVIVVGYGFAGAIAAISAADAGARVLLLEKNVTPGGISICSAGGLRIAEDFEQAFKYLRATCGGKTPDAVLRTLAEGMTMLPARVAELAEINGTRISKRASPANYPLPGFETFDFVYVEDIPDVDIATIYPQVAGSPAGAMLFHMLEANVVARSIEVRLGCAVERLISSDDLKVCGVEVGAEAIRSKSGVILACGGFEGDPSMQAQFWPGGAALNAAYRLNTGDGIRMAQAVGADLWHMWHYHGSYGFQASDPNYPFGVRVKRLPDWTPGPTRELPVMAWILVDRHGRRFMNEYEPYVQDTGARPFDAFDPATQSYARQPAFMITDEAGIARYPLGKPTFNDPQAHLEWSPDNSMEIASGLLRRVESVTALAERIGTTFEAMQQTLEQWNAACESDADPVFRRPPTSMQALHSPYYVAEVWPIVSNTQGGPVHDERQRVLDPEGRPIPGLWAAGELGSAFGHLYMSGGNLAECFIGGRIAGLDAAAVLPGRRR